MSKKETCRTKTFLLHASSAFGRIPDKQRMSYMIDLLSNNITGF